MLVLSLGDPMIVVSAAIYFVVVTLAVSAVRPAVVVLLAAWAIATILAGAVIAGADGMVGEVIVGAISYGTAAVGLWTIVAFVLLVLLDPSRREVS